MKKQQHKKRTSAIPFSLRLVRGAIGRQFVIKHYAYGIVRTKYPDMTKITASKGQRNCRNRFREAVNFAKQVMKDPVQKKIWQQKVKNKRRVFNQVIKAYLHAAKETKKQRVITGKYLLRQWFKENTISIQNQANRTDPFYHLRLPETITHHFP